MGRGKGVPVERFTIGRHFPVGRGSVPGSLAFKPVAVGGCEAGQCRRETDKRGEKQPENNREESSGTGLPGGAKDLRLKKRNIVQSNS